MQFWQRWFGPNIDRLRQAGDRAGLMAALEHREAGVRLAAASALAENGDEPGVTFLLQLYGQKLASQALDSLVLVADRCVAPLSSALDAEDVHVRHRAALALARIKEKGPVDRVLETLLRDRCTYLCGVYEDRGCIPFQRLVAEYGGLAAPVLTRALNNPAFDQVFVSRALKWLPLAIETNGHAQ
jgi:hypothetical protein